MTTESIKDLLVTFGVVYGSRFSKKEKEIFIEEIQKYSESNNFDLKIYDFYKAKHLIVGNLKDSALTLLVPYDTPGSSFFAQDIYYPTNKEIQLEEKKKTIVTKAIMDSVLLVLIIGLAYLTVNITGPLRYLTIAGMILLGLVYFVTRTDKSQKVNMNFNSASIALSLSMMNENISIIFIDDYYKNIRWKDALNEIKDLDLSKALLLESLASTDDVIYLKDKKSNLIINDKENLLMSNEDYSSLYRGTIIDNQIAIKMNDKMSDINVDVEGLESIRNIILEMIGGNK